MTFNLLLLASIVLLLRLSSVSNSISLSTLSKISKLFVSSILFYLFVTLTSLNYLLDYYYEFFIFSELSTNSLFSNSINKFVILNSTGLGSIDVYLYPFIYVFLLVTALSITFCLTYNSDELSSFMFYCLLILVSGYALFFSDSMIIFFFAYEMLLVPSFFILYKFAKTRRCVEAAYLMFF